MMKIARLFSEHPASVGETYVEHLGHAASFGARMVVAGAACVVHAVLPFLFVETASRAVMALHERMVTRRRLEGTGAPGGAAQKGVES
jgi:hypothetical protein